MAETKVSARDYILLADIDNNASYSPVACLTSNNITSSLNVIDATSKCGDQFQPGPAYNQTIKADGFAIDQTGTNLLTRLQMLDIDLSAFEQGVKLGSFLLAVTYIDQS